MPKKRTKPKKHKIEDVSSKEIAKRIEEVFKKMASEILHEKDPEFITSQRGRANVSFNKEAGIIELGAKKTKRNFLNIGHARKFMQTTLIGAKTYDYLNHNKTASIREIYYELKHTIEGTKENTFEGQPESDAIIVDLEHAVDTIREKLNLHANPKGSLYGDITLKDKMHYNDEFNASKLGRGGWSIMSRLEPEEIEIVDINADYVLVIETEAMYERLVEERFAKKHRAVLISTGGQAARGTRRLIGRIHKEFNLPVYVFTDGDPYGWYIYSVIKQGSMALAAHSALLATPEARYIGMTLDDVERYGLEQVTEKMKDGDIKRAKELMAYPWFQTKEWQAQLKKALKEKIRIEQQALANRSLSFVADKYLPEKIENEIFLP